MKLSLIELIEHLTEIANRPNVDPRSAVGIRLCAPWNVGGIAEVEIETIKFHDEVLFIEPDMTDYFPA